MNLVLAKLAAEEKNEKNDLWIANQCARVPALLLPPARDATPVWAPSNGRIVDVMADEKERKRRVVWSERETQIFSERRAATTAPQQQRHNHGATTTAPPPRRAAQVHAVPEELPQDLKLSRAQVGARLRLVLLPTQA